MIPLFSSLLLETFSLCNRRCTTCIRNSDPDRKAWEPWFVPNELPMETIVSILQQAFDLGFRGEVSLIANNEPLLDKRLPEIVRLVKEMGLIPEVFSNGDFLTKELAAKLDGVLNHFGIALYDKKTRESRKQWISTLFSKTLVSFSHGHVINHFQREMPNPIDAPCSDLLARCIINHRGDANLCCEDGIGRFNLGNIFNMSLSDLWFSEKRKVLFEILSKPGGRKFHPYCAIPRMENMESIEEVEHT